MTCNSDEAVFVPSVGKAATSAFAGAADCGCGCGGAGGCGVVAAIRSCPWWVWLAAFGVAAMLSGNDGAKSLAFGPKVRRKK